MSSKMLERSGKKLQASKPEHEYVNTAYASKIHIIIYA